MNHQPKVSIIVPVYNAESTIRKCVDSLLAQTLTDFEVVLVDDGSPDRCGEICDDYAKQDSRVKVVHQQNGGVSAARQAGIDNSTGEYTIHADPDDWVEPTELEELYNKAKEDDADMVICDFYENDDIYHKQEPSSLESQVVLSELFQQLHGSCCNKLVRQSCYSKYNVRFPKGIYYCEDCYVICALLVHKIKVAYLPKAFYHYVRYPQNLTLVNYYDDKTYEHDVRILEIFEQLLINDTVICNRMRELYRISMTIRAFYYGGKVYNSKLFKERFYDNYDIIGRHGFWKGRILIGSACLGYYKPSYFIYSILFRVKQMLKRFSSKHLIAF